MLGMIFGVGAVIAMLSIGAGAEQQAMEMIDRMGPRNVLVRNPALTNDELNEIRRQSLGVSLRDAAIIEDGVPGVELTAPRVEVDAYMIMAPGAQTVPSFAAGVFLTAAEWLEVTSGPNARAPSANLMGVDVFERLEQPRRRRAPLGEQREARQVKDRHEG